eukprot:3190259-Alexandrium_andersonii.AAC.1
MSASLVGSEMCIRDSFATSRHLGFPISCRAFARSRFCAFALSRFCDSVSYTHLKLPTICSV